MSGIPIVTLCLIALAGAESDERLRPDRDDYPIRESAVIVRGSYAITDAEGNGAIRVEGDNITINFNGALIDGARDGRSPDKYSGVGVYVRGRNVTIRNLRVRGFKVGVLAENADGLMIEDCILSDNFRQRLRSTPDAADERDWLHPRDNEKSKWKDRYGAALCVERSKGVSIARVRVRDSQNGIILDRVDDAKIYDCDCSFLSGWGLAMWRSNRNVISRNAFDFCIRGYSHGVYNRGQDSAGILMFEQCNENIIAENSATHCGNGFFGFGGMASLAGDRRTGNNANKLIRNDFSYSAVHGIEMTFSFQNRFLENKLIGNTVCGIRAGYAQETLILNNTIEANGNAGDDLDRGGINIEHGFGNVIARNRFAANAYGVILRSDDDPHLAESPWVRANDRGSRMNTIMYNSFAGDKVAITLRRSEHTTILENELTGVGSAVEADKHSKPIVPPESDKRHKMDYVTPSYPVFGANRPRGARDNRIGRSQIFMTEWGPFDFVDTTISPKYIGGGSSARLNILAGGGNFRFDQATENVTVSPTEGQLPATVTVSTTKQGLQPFELSFRTSTVPDLRVAGSLFRADWRVRFYTWDADRDPRGKSEAWAKVVSALPVHELRVSQIDFDWSDGVPSEKVPADHFATVAETTVNLPASFYTLRTVSDDGIRVFVDANPVINDWTHHAQKTLEARIELTAGKHTFRIEHFEISGRAQLQFRLIPNEPASSP